MAKKLSIIKEGTGDLRIEGDSLSSEGAGFVGDGTDYRPIHCSELREFLKGRSWNNEMFKFYYTSSTTDSETNTITTTKTFKLKFPNSNTNYTTSENSVDDGLPIITPAAESTGSPDIIISRKDLENVSSPVIGVFNDIYGDQKGESELMINRSTKSVIDVVEDSVTILAIDSENTSTYTNILNLNDLINRVNTPGISAKVDATFLYSINNIIGGGNVTFQAFSINDEGEVEKDNLVFDKETVIVEYVNGILRIFPLSEEVSECILSDVVITYGRIK